VFCYNRCHINVFKGCRALCLPYVSGLVSDNLLSRDFKPNEILIMCVCCVAMVPRDSGPYGMILMTVCSVLYIFPLLLTGNELVRYRPTCELCYDQSQSNSHLC
jgi:hypothetical protein